MSTEAEPGSENTSAARVFGDYELLDEIARGGMGIVYRARQRSLGRTVALKLLLGGQLATREFIHRFRAEAAAAAALQHPNIVAIHDVGVQDGNHFFSMDYIQGQNLAELVGSDPLPAKKAAGYVKQIAEAIHYAHNQSILHRDLKPSNILIESSTDQPRVTDFGLAKRLDSEVSLTLSGQVLGSPHFMPPEQASADRGKIGRHSDVYALGGILFYLLTARAPFQGETLESTIHLVLNSEPRSPRLLNPSVPRDLETICLKCLQKEPRQRYQTAEQLAADLGRFLNNEPLQARPVSRPERAWRWVRRNPASATALAAVLALAGAVGIITWQATTPPPVSKPPSLAILVRSGDANSSTLAKEWSRDLSHFFSELSAVETLDRTKVLKWEADASAPINAIGKGLGVNAVLLAQVRDTSERVQLDVELATFPNRARLWSHGFTQSAAEWPFTRSQIAREVMARLERSPSDRDKALMRRPESLNQAALNQYYQARRFLDAFSDSAAEKAISHFETATRLDPQFAQAYAGLAECYISLSLGDHAPAPLFQKATAAIQKALELDSRLPEAKVLDWMMKLVYQWDWNAVEEGLAEVLQSDLSVVEGNACYLHALDVLGRREEAVDTVKRALSLHPTSFSIRTELGCASYYAGLFTQGEAYSRENLANDPENPNAYFLLARILAQQGNYDEALKLVQQGKTKPGGTWSALDAELGYIYARQGERDRALDVLGKLRERERNEYIDGYIFAIIYAGLRDAERMFKALHQACDQKSGWIPSLTTEPKFAEYRSDPRYAEILSRLKLPLNSPQSENSKLNNK